MKMMKKLLVFVAAMTMVLALTACGESYPKKYEYTEPRGKGEQGYTLTLEDDSKYTFTFFADNSSGEGKAMEIEFSGEYTLEENTVTFTSVDGGGYYMVGQEKTEFDVTLEDPGMYVTTPAKGTYVFTISDDGTIAPVIKK